MTKETTGYPWTSPISRGHSTTESTAAAGSATAAAERKDEEEELSLRLQGLRPPAQPKDSPTHLPISILTPYSHFLNN